jgi:outer membrane immunogenic protein
MHFSYSTGEASAFGNVVVTVPGTVLGGVLKFSGFMGYNEVELDLKSNAVAILDPNQSGSATNQSVIAGGTVLWALQNTYALASIVGAWGQTSLRDSVDDCGYLTPPHPTGCNRNHYNFSTSGFIGTVTAGHVIDLGGASGPKLDLRGSIGHTRMNGESFNNMAGDQQAYSFSTWTGTAAVTLFSNMTVEGNALLRPYIQGYVRQEWAYRNAFDFLLTDGTSGTVRQNQAHLYGGVDAGLTYTQGKTTVGAAIYYEASGDERTLGGRMGVSWKLDDVTGGAQKRRFNWSGFHVGANAGLAAGTSHAVTSMTCLDTSQVILDPALHECAFNLPSQFAAIAAAGTGRLSDRGFAGGGQAGLNWQTGGLVWGFEVDAETFKLAVSRSAIAANPANLADLITVASSFDTDWLLTARGRIGWAIEPQVLLYATGGVALTGLSASNLISSASGSLGAANSSGLVTGWVLGGGAEWALNRNWTVRGEYLYLDFGKVTANAQSNNIAAPTTFDNALATSTDLSAHIVRGGLNYKF